MRRYLPSVRDEDLADLYTDLEVPAGTARPHVYLDMVTSVDGAATVDGRTERLGGDADRIAFRRLRETCDVVLVGAGTVRIEAYGPARPRPDSVERRRARGLADRPTVAVVSASLDLDPAARLFSDPDRPPLVLTVADAPADRLAALEGRAEIVTAGRGRVDLDDALVRLAARGVTRVLCEGGPTLNAALFAAGLVDEVFVTVTPLLAGGAGPRMLAPGVDVVPAPLTLVELREHGGELLLRYRAGG